MSTPETTKLSSGAINGQIIKDEHILPGPSSANDDLTRNNTHRSNSVQSADAKLDEEKAPKVRRSRTGCETCRKRKVKCDELRPRCTQCSKRDRECVYSVRLNWVSCVVPSAAGVLEELPITEDAEVTVENHLSKTHLKRSTSNVKGFLLDFEEVEFDSDDSLGLPPESIRKFRLRAIPKLGKGPSYGMRNAAPRWEPEFSTNADSTVDEIPENDFRLSPLPASPVSSPSSHSPKPDPLENFTITDFVSHFVNFTANDLVPIFYEENPYATLLPSLALDSEPLQLVLAAFGATHQAQQLTGIAKTPTSLKLVAQCDHYVNGLAKRRDYGELLLHSTLLALLHRGDAPQWQRYMTMALIVLENQPLEALLGGPKAVAEVNSLCMRLVGTMIATGDLFGIARVVTRDFPLLDWWPQWSGSLDYLTALDLNLLPLFVASIRLIEEVTRDEEPMTLRRRSEIYSRALFVILRMNDYWLEEFRPGCELTTMCIMFQQALQLHVYRRVLEVPTRHPAVQRIVNHMMSFLEQFIPVSSRIQSNMTFILMTLASEAVNPEHHVSLLLRMEAMVATGFPYNLYARDEIERHMRLGKSLIQEPGIHIM